MGVGGVEENKKHIKKTTQTPSRPQTNKTKNQPTTTHHHKKKKQTIIPKKQ